jgi:plasmid stabilization system protein ParE
MPEGDKSSYTNKQKRKAEHIEEGYKKEGVSAKTAAARAWATVNKQDGGGKKSGSGRAGAKKTTAKKSGAKKTTARKSSARKTGAKKK